MARAHDAQLRQLLHDAYLSIHHTHAPTTVAGQTATADPRRAQLTKLEALLRPENKDQLVKILTNHVVPGKALETDDLKRTRSAKTVGGEEVKFELVRGRVRVDNARVTGDYKASDRKSTRLNSSHIPLSRMPSSA